MSDLLQHFDKNELGRDFVVGDLHGCIDHFKRLLDKIEFDPVKDRMFSVGDLVDRGPDSMACMRLLREPWFHAVMGNHEDMMLEAVGSNLSHGVHSWINNGGDWGIEQFEDGNPEFFELVELVDELPHAIIIKTAELGLIGIAHAEPPSEWSKGCIEDEANHLLWSRIKIEADEGELAKGGGVDFSVHGHTITNAITVRDEINAFWIDMGCYSTGNLCTLQVSGPGIVWPTEHIVEG